MIVQEVTFQIKVSNPIDTKARISKLQDLAKLPQEDLNLIHELATKEKYLKALKKHENTLRGLALVM